MSTYWDIYCRTCAEGCGFHVNHGEERLGALLRDQALWRHVPTLENSDLELRLLGDEYNGGGHWPDFARRHFCHDVTLRNEYGEFLDECNERLTCANCGAFSSRCRLARGHAGAHTAGFVP